MTAAALSLPPPLLGALFSPQIGKACLSHYTYSAGYIYNAVRMRHADNSVTGFWSTSVVGRNMC
jgi:hypothetical protein